MNSAEMPRCRTIFTLIMALSVLLLTRCVREGTNDDCVFSVEVTVSLRGGCPEELPVANGELLLLVFDEQERLAATWQSDQAPLVSDVSAQLTFGDKGIYTVVAWWGLSESFALTEDITVGESRRDDVLFSLREDGGVAADLEGVWVFTGSSRAFYTGPEADDGAASISVDLYEVTNRIRVSVEGLPAGGDDYGVYIQAANGTMNMDGGIVPDTALRYDPSAESMETVLVSDFNLLRLETGHEYTLVVMNYTDDTPLYSGSLLGSLILKNPEVSLRCDHDFEIRFTAEDQCACGTYTIAEIWVNDWLVHSYGTEL